MRILAQMENEKLYKCAFILYEEGVKYDREYFREIFSAGSFYPKAQFICPAKLNQKRISPDITGDVCEVILDDSRGIVVATMKLKLKIMSLSLHYLTARYRILMIVRMKLSDCSTRYAPIYQKLPN